MANVSTLEVPVAPATEGAKQSHEHMVRIENLNYTYPRSDSPALRDVNLDIHEGDVVLITGPSGAGKTTLLRLINGLIPHFFGGTFKGSVVVKGYDTKSRDPGFFSTFVGYLFQNPSAHLIAPTVKEELAFGPENLGVPAHEILARIERTLKEMGLEGCEGRNPHFLSGGEQQAVALASVVVMEPRILVLDEPTSNLDPLGTERVMAQIQRLARDGRRTILIVEHKLEETAHLADRLIVLDDGAVLLDARPKDALNQAEELLGHGVRIPQVTLLFHHLVRKRLVNLESLPLTVEEAYELLAGKPRRAPRKPRTEATQGGKEIARAVDLSFTYPDGTEALSDVNLTIREGEFVGLIGQNASGKTTLARLFNGLLKPTKGKVYVDGEDTSEHSTAYLATKVGYVFQNPDSQLFCRTVEEELTYGPRNLKLDRKVVAERVREVSEAIGITHLLRKNPFQLSQAEKQKVAVGSVLTMRPKILIVDEPTTGQDHLSSLRMMEFYRKLNSQGATLVVITHDMNLAAQYASRIVVMQSGRIIAEGPARTVFARSQILREAHLKPPQVSELFNRVFNGTVDWTVLTVEEALEAFEEALA